MQELSSTVNMPWLIQAHPRLHYDPLIHPILGVLHATIYTRHMYVSASYELRNDLNADPLITFKWCNGGILELHWIPKENCLAVWLSDRRGFAEVCKTCPMQLTCIP